MGLYIRQGFSDCQQSSNLIPGDFCLLMRNFRGEKGAGRKIDKAGFSIQFQRDRKRNALLTGSAATGEGGLGESQPWVHSPRKLYDV